MMQQYYHFSQKSLIQARSYLCTCTAKHNTNNFTAGNKRTRCGTCDGCLTSDCGKCKHCQDKKKFGGPGKLKKACLKRECHGMSQIASHTNTSSVTSATSKIENKYYNIYVFYVLAR